MENEAFFFYKEKKLQKICPNMQSYNIVYISATRHVQGDEVISLQCYMFVWYACHFSPF